MIDEATPQPERPKMPAKVQFLVTCDVALGEVEVRGPIHQKLFAIKVLTDAIRIVVDYNPKPSVIIDPTKDGNGRLTLPS